MHLGVDGLDIETLDTQILGAVILARRRRAATEPP
jgi:hypothetical protein